MVQTRKTLYFLADDGSNIPLPPSNAEDKKYGIEKIADDGVKREYKHPFVIRAEKTYWCYICRKTIKRGGKYLEKNLEGGEYLTYHYECGKEE